MNPSNEAADLESTASFDDDVRMPWQVAGFKVALFSYAEQCH